MSDRSRLPFQRSELPVHLGRTLHAARLRDGRSRREIAEAVGIAGRTLARIERGAQKPRWPTLERLCIEVGLSAFTVARPWALQALDMPTDPRSAPGLMLRALRRERGMSLVDLADVVGVSAATLSRFERGLTASRLLGSRVGAPEIAFNDRAIVLDGSRLAGAMGYATPEALERACISAFVATRPRA